MTSSAGGVPSTSDLGPAAEARLSSFNAVFTLALILTQVSSPDQVMRLVTTSIPSIVSCQQVLIWHLARSGEYYQRAPEAIGEILAELTGSGPLEVADFPPSWAFPITSPLADEQIFLIIVDSKALSNEETFLLSVLAQLSGTVIAKLELIAAEQSSAQRISALNTELESTVSTLTRIMEVHHRLNEIAASAGVMGIAETLHELTRFGVFISDAGGNILAATSDVPGDYLEREPAEQRRELIRRLESSRRPLYHGRAWLVLAGAEVLGVIATIEMQK